MNVINLFSANIVGQDPTSSTSENAHPETSSQQQQSQQPSQEQQLPDGVDPSFLAALPEDMRDEVIAEQLRYVKINDL